jgi:hypothetical protein
MGFLGRLVHGTVPSYSILRTLGAQRRSLGKLYPKKIIERDGIHKSTISFRFLILEFCTFIFVFLQNKLECTSLVDCFMISETGMGIDSFFLRGNSTTYTDVEVSGHNLESSQT